MMRHAVRTTIAVAALSFAVGLVACGGAEPPTAQAQDAPPPPAYVGEVGDLTSDQIDRQRRAEQGDASAQINLGVMYATGEGVPQDYVSAHMWLNLAAAAGVARGGVGASKAREMVAESMTREQIAEAQARAREWANR